MLFPVMKNLPSLPLLFAALVLLPSLAFAQSYAPSVDHVSLLDMRYYAQSGGFMLEGLQLVFPPAEEVSGRFSVTNNAGETVAEIPLRLERWPDYPAFGMLKPNGSGIGQLNAPGTYTMTVTLGEATIAAMTYTLMEKGGDDPFNPQKTYFRDGPWQRLAYVSAQPERPDEALQLNFWISLREIGADDNTKIAIEVKRGGTPVAKSRSDFVVSSADWQFFSHPLTRPDGKSHFTRADLTASDGTYSLTVLADGKPVKTYALTVQGGNIMPSARSELSATPKPDFLTPRRVNTSAGSSSRYFMEEVFWVETN